MHEELKQAYGIQFQDVFSRVMKSKYGINYIPTSTYGKSGDLKVDGVLNFSTAFAVYAPEVYTDDKAIQKLKDDFKGFMKLKKSGVWANIQEYIIVIKRERSGVTSRIINLVSEFNKEFPVNFMTLDDIVGIVNGYQPFSSDGILLKDLKKDITEIMEYIVDTDFASQPFRMNLSDEICYIVNKWQKKNYIFSNQNIENTKSEILQSLSELNYYLTPEFMHPLTDGRLLFNNDSIEAGEKLRNVLQPHSYSIRCKIKKSLDQLYNIL